MQGRAAEQLLLALLAVDDVVAAVCNSGGGGGGAAGGTGAASAGPRSSPRVRVHGMLYARAAAAFQQVGLMHGTAARPCLVVVEPYLLGRHMASFRTLATPNSVHTPKLLSKMLHA